MKRKKVPATAIKLMKQMAKDGKGYSTIAKVLANQGYKLPMGGTFKGKDVSKYLCLAGYKKRPKPRKHVYRAPKENIKVIGAVTTSDGQTYGLSADNDTHKPISFVTPIEREATNENHLTIIEAIIGTKFAAAQKIELIKLFLW